MAIDRWGQALDNTGGLTPPRDRTRATFKKMGSHVRNLVHEHEFIIGIPIRETETQQILDLTTSAVGGGTLDEVTIYLYKQQTRSINA